MRPLTIFGWLCFLTLAGADPTTGQVPARSRPTMPALDCRDCHTGGTPTRADPKLLACPRLQVTGFHLLSDAPATMTLGSATGRYGPVAFSHRVHALMAGAGNGCEGCHHYDQARPIQKCSACHSSSRARADLSRPDLKAAMHRQCLDCHRDWNPGVTCASCHQPAGATAAADDTRPVPPARVVYQTPAARGRTVTFFHDEHVERFGLACGDCHQGASCAACHRAPVPTATELARSGPAGRPDSVVHASCSTCHEIKGCATCHRDQPRRVPAFDHRVRTGWALNRFHAPLACKACHGAAGAFGPLDRDCESCHAGWQKRFTHQQVGLELDELHGGLECASCHPDATFSARPACGECHDDLSYPAKRPGKSVPPTRKP